MSGTPEEVAARWQQKSAAASEKTKAGVMAVTVAPQQKAIASADHWQTQVSSQAAKDKYKASLARSGLQDWQQAMVGKGIPRIASGTAAAQSKFASFLASFLPFQAQVTARVRAMPKGDLEANIARAAAQIRGTAAFKRS